MHNLNPEIVFRRTLWTIAILVGASLGAAFMALELKHRSLLGLSDLVNLDKEQNIPTVFSMLQLMAAGTIAWKLGVRESDVSLRRLWRFLSLGLLWIGIDEALKLHERLNKIPIGELRRVSFFNFAWVLPAMVVVGVCGVIMLRLLLALPRPTARMFALSGGLFVAGAVGVEMLGAHYDRLSGQQTWIYTFCYTLEEILEMIGPALFIRTALRYAQQPSREPGQAGGAMAWTGPEKARESLS